MSRKCGTGEGGWVYLKGENSMVMSGLGYRKVLVARGEYFFLFPPLNECLMIIIGPTALYIGLIIHYV